jgi:hypothetical protein
MGIAASRDLTAETTDPGSPLTFATTSTSHSTSSWATATGSGATLTVATSFSGT